MDRLAGTVTYNRASEPARDRWSLGSSLVIAAGFGGLAMLYSLSLFARFHSHLLHGHLVWFAPGDVWMSVDTGRYVWDGSLNKLYGVYQGFNALPLSSVVLAPIAELITRHNLVENVVPVARPSAWLIVGPYTLAFNVFLLDAVRRLAWDIGARRHLWLAQMATVVTVLVPCFEWSHFEDVLALTFVLHALRYVFRQEFVCAGLLLSVAICWKQWAVVVVPLFVFSTPRGLRIRTMMAACALPGFLASFFLTIEFHYAARALFNPDVVPSRSGYKGVLAGWLGIQSARTIRVGVVAAAVVVGWFFRKAVRPAHTLAVVCVLLLLRPLTEPVTWSYYWAPALCLAGLIGLTTRSSVRIRDWVWPAFAILWSLPHPGRPSVGWWWVVEILLLVFTGLQMAGNCGLSVGKVTVEAQTDGSTAASKAVNETLVPPGG